MEDFEEPFYTRLKVFVQRLKEEVDPNSGKNRRKLPKQTEDPNTITAPIVKPNVYDK